MVELRWTTPEGTTTDTPKLQWRNRKADPWGCLTLWEDWQDVPFAVVPRPPVRALHPTWDDFKTAKQQGVVAGDGLPCPNDHDPDCGWPNCNCRRG